MGVASYSELQRKLKVHMDRVCDDHAPLPVMRKNAEHVVLLSLADYAMHEG
jgi:prevent-host-death family protein